MILVSNNHEGIGGKKKKGGMGSHGRRCRSGENAVAVSKKTYHIDATISGDGDDTLECSEIDTC
jgi:hypothetical protein